MSATCEPVLHQYYSNTFHGKPDSCATEDQALDRLFHKEFTTVHHRDETHTRDQVNVISQLESVLDTTASTLPINEVQMHSLVQSFVRNTGRSLGMGLPPALNRVPQASYIAPCPAGRHPFSPPEPSKPLKALLAGSGLDSMSNPTIVSKVVELTELPTEDVNLLYIGTPTYDIAKFRTKQTREFSRMGVQVSWLEAANQSPSYEEMERKVEEAHIILVSGGNTLYAVDRWRHLGLDVLLKEAAYDGKVMAGGSAGALCWFDSGHSDSMDPDTYRIESLRRKDGEGQKENMKFSQGHSKDWEYVRVEGLSILPGFCCPHYDKTQSNGKLRMDDFAEMMKNSPIELGVCIDHYAALQVDGNSFEVFSVPGKKRSVSDDKNKSVPGVWLKWIDEDGLVKSKVCPSRGKLSNLLQSVDEPEKCWRDSQLVQARNQNPIFH